MNALGLDLSSIDLIKYDRDQPCALAGGRRAEPLKALTPSEYIVEISEDKPSNLNPFQNH
jgi:hypothetical protein